MLTFILMMQKKQIIIFTDLDSTLLDKDTFKFDAIDNYFRQLISEGIIIIPNSSKTEAELIDFNKQNNFNLSFIVENGSSIHGLNLIHENLPKIISMSRPVDKIYEIFNKKIPYDLKQKLVFISELNINDQEKIFGLSLHKINLALQRKHSIPIQFNGSEVEKNALTKIINDSGLAVHTGGRIMNICDKVNKSTAIVKTLKLISKRIKNEIITNGVGDNQNEIDMLGETDYSCLVKNDNFDSSLINMDNLIKSTEPSPKGWADVIKMAIQKIKT